MSHEIADVLDKAAEREAVLNDCADLFEEIAEFMTGVCKRTFAAYDAMRGDARVISLMRKHRQALSVRDDYRGLARENREDARHYAVLREAAAKARETA
jgi:NADPH-dependent glutamate synthase beta subunit-like oxidoreductase